MSKRGVSSVQHKLPANPSWIEIPRTDGDERLWDRLDREEVVDKEGHVNFYKPCTIDESMAVKWRKEIGAALASRLDMAEGPSYVLKDWPEGYHMFDHHKGAVEHPRHDIYLIGSVNVGRFRSIPEFIPHALWLTQDATMNRNNCQCKYCSKLPQRTITTQLGLRAGSTPSASPVPTRRIRDPKPAPPRPLRPFAAVRRVPKPVKLHVPPRQVMLPERHSDLRAASAQGSMKLQRFHREHEVVWCALDPLIHGPTPEESICFWPAIVDEANLKSVAIGADGLELPKGADGLPRTVEQSTMYKLQLLGVSHMRLVPDHQVIPYQAYGATEALLECMRKLSWSSLNPDPGRIAAFDPFGSPAPSVDHFAEAVSPFSLAIQIASNISGSWCITHDWDYTYTASAGPAPATPTPGLSSSTSLQDVITRAAQENADSISTSPSQLVRTRKRFQGMWWGCERIWADDLVRLKLAREQVAPEGTDNIYPPSGPTEAAIRYHAEHANGNESARGAESRGLFLRMESIFLVDLTAEDGSPRPECRVSGMVFELAEEDWPDPREEAEGFGSASVLLGGTSAPHVVTDFSAPSAVVRALKPGESALRELSPNEHLSRPASTAPYLLPPAPIGFKFRPILRPGHEMEIELPLISGRYYARILQHPALSWRVSEALAHQDDARFNYVWALEGLAAGFWNSVDPVAWKQSRTKMVKDADALSREQLTTLWEGMKEAELGHSEESARYAMEVDG